MDDVSGEVPSLDIECVDRLHGLVVLYMTLGDAASFIEDTVCSDEAEVEGALGSVGLEMTNVPDVYDMCRSTRCLHAATADWRDAFDRFVTNVEAMAEGFGRSDDAEGMLEALSALPPEDRVKVAEAVDEAHTASYYVLGISNGILPKSSANLAAEVPDAAKKAVETLVGDVTAACDMVSGAFGVYNGWSV